MSTLNVTIVQSDLHWHDARRNREQFTATIESIEEPTDLVRANSVLLHRPSPGAAGLGHSLQAAQDQTD